MGSFHLHDRRASHESAAHGSGVDAPLVVRRAAEDRLLPPAERVAASLRFWYLARLSTRDVLAQLGLARALDRAGRVSVSNAGIVPLAFGPCGATFRARRQSRRGRRLDQ